MLEGMTPAFVKISLSEECWEPFPCCLLIQETSGIQACGLALIPLVKSFKFCSECRWPPYIFSVQGTPPNVTRPNFNGKWSNLKFMWAHLPIIRNLRLDLYDLDLWPWPQIPCYLDPHDLWSWPLTSNYEFFCSDYFLVDFFPSDFFFSTLHRTDRQNRQKAMHNRPPGGLKH